MKMKKYNNFHLVDLSPWPIFLSFLIFCFMISGLIYVKLNMMLMFLVSLMLLITLSFNWWKDIHRESSFQGNHSFPVMNGLKIGMVLFILSELFFFISFFWTFFHLSISPSTEIGQAWPPESIIFFNSMSIPLLNTILLLSSGASLTWCHHAMLMNDFFYSKMSLAFTIFLGMSFTMFQILEYSKSMFCMSDSCFGSVFFLLTGFHGLHVVLGIAFLSVSFFRFNSFSQSHIHMLGFEMSAWYWHFVDVIWLFLYTFVYWVMI